MIKIMKIRARIIQLPKILINQFLNKKLSFDLRLYEQELFSQLKDE